jgi:hypothetical protein
MEPVVATLPPGVETSSPGQSINLPRKPPETSEAPGRPPDVHAWAFEQAGHLRAGRFHLLDRDGLADEIEDVGRSEFKSLASNIAIVLIHMLKWDHQPTKRSRSWSLSIEEHRSRVRYDLADSPSLRALTAEAVDRAYRLARLRAARETRVLLDHLPETCPYAFVTIVDRSFSLEPR